MSKSRINHNYKLDNLQSILIFFGLFGLGITLPLLDLYGQNPEIFIANRSSSAQIVTFALIVALLPTAAMGVIWWLNRAMNHRAGEITELMGVSIAGFFVTSSLLRHAMASTNLSLAIAVLAAVWLGLYGRRRGIVRTWLSYLAFIPLISLVYFLAFSDSAELLWKEDAEAEKYASIANPISVVFLVLDELPLASLLREDGQINDSLFPNFARVAESSYWFRNFATNSVNTAESVPIMLSGVIKEGTKPTSADHPNTLFTLLGESHAMYVRESVTSLCPDSICKPGQDEKSDLGEPKRTDGSLRLLLDDALIVYGHLALPPLLRNRLPSIEGRWGGFLGQLEVSDERDSHAAGVDLPPAPARGRPRWINDFLAAMGRLASSKSPSLHYTHLMAPHIPWRVNPTGTIYEAPDYDRSIVAGLRNGYWPKDQAMPTQGLQRHLAQLGAVDKLLGYYVDELQRTGFWNKALVIITSDHGASFKAGSHRRDVRGDGADALYRVPLIIHLPGQDDGVIKDEAAFSVDILPTIIDVLGVTVDWPLMGRSLLGKLPAIRTHDYDHFIGRRVALDMRLEALMREVAHNYTLIPDTSSWESIAAVGPHRQMLGKSLAELGSIGDESIFLVFDRIDEDFTIDERSGEVPTFIRGRVSMHTESKTNHFLIAVNGVVAGAGTTSGNNHDAFYFYGYVPESAYRRGKNSVELIVLSDKGDWRHSISGHTVSNTSLLTIATPLLSPVYPDPGVGFKAPPFNPVNSEPPAIWKEFPLSMDGLRLKLQPPPHEFSFGARYIYVPITADLTCDVKVLIGSDDTLEVWYEGEIVLEHKSPRPARLGDNQVLLRLKPGVNHLYFRVDNRGGAWRLVTKMNPCSISGSTISQSSTPKFSSALLSPVFSHPEGGFKAPPFIPPNGAPPAYWHETRASTEGLLDLNLRPSRRATRYIYAPIISEEAREVELLIGSDDTLEVWFEEEDKFELGSHQLRLHLKPGVNHLYFRVDNRGGAWQLIAVMKPSRNSQR